jgi:hypothetical protein
LAVLLWVSTHTPPHVAMPVGQPHAPFVHAWPPEQRLPQEPQLVASVSVLTQLLPHCVSPTAHVAEHVLCEQSSPPVQALPHAPQFAPSETTFTQPVAQALSPAVQVHAPLVQACPSAHLLLQAPQF